MTNKVVFIIGAGPAGLTAALELLKAGGIKVIIAETDGQVGGLSKTVVHRGNRMDIGGHRFFSKSDWVMDWWQQVLPIEKGAEQPSAKISYQNKHREIIPSAEAVGDDRAMLIRPRLSRIYFLRKFFDYPVSLDFNTLRNLGPKRILKIGLSYLWAQQFKISPEKNLEDFLINRFGRELYLTFFKEYTEKVWGVPCNEISAEWGAQRIKGLSIAKALSHAVMRLLGKSQKGMRQKQTETSLIERFLYPRLGPGQMWETVAEQVMQLGGELLLQHQVVGLSHNGNHIQSVSVKNHVSGVTTAIAADYVISTMPVRDLILGLQPELPQDVRDIARGLQYRDFITIGLLVTCMAPNRQSLSSGTNNMPKDNWIYVQDKGVKLGRLQIFNNWSPGLVKDPKTIWLGLEYFCQEGDSLWSKNNQDLVDLAITELIQIGLIEHTEVVKDNCVVRVNKAYPGYFGTYNQFDTIRSCVDLFENLYLVGRNGMHRYNNQDHSMLTAYKAAQHIMGLETNKQAIWDVNAEDSYHEIKEH